LSVGARDAEAAEAIEVGATATADAAARATAVRRHRVIPYRLSPDGVPPSIPRSGRSRLASASLARQDAVELEQAALEIEAAAEPQRSVATTTQWHRTTSSRRSAPRNLQG